MRRREFITLLGGAAAWPLAARAQQAGRTYRLGVLHNQGPQSPQFPPFYDELRRLGFVEVQNLIVDSRGYAVRTEQFPAVAAELVKAQVDALLAGGAAAARAAQAARTIPILTLTDDMVGQGLVASLARPGGNTTGISILATELDSKRQEILMEMVPAARRVAVLADANTAAPQNMRALQEAARARGVELAVHLVERPERIGPQIEEARRAGAEALNVLASPDPLCAPPRHLRAHRCAAATGHVPVAGVRRGGWIDRLWSAHHPDVPAVGAAAGQSL
jgi:putative tryptophan/tyrosine transport system substrate-binding protein